MLTIISEEIALSPPASHHAIAMNSELSISTSPPPATRPPPLPRTRRNWVPWIITTCAVAVAFVALIRPPPHTAGRPVSSWPRGPRGGEDEFPEMRERWSAGAGTTKVVRILLEGPIFRGSMGFFSAGDMVESVVRQIRAAHNDTAVRAILLEISSPGGAVTACDELHAALRRFRDSREDRRVVAFVRDLAASGGYYVAVAADHIIAEPTAIIGSIGVIFESLNWHQLTQKVGVDATIVKSGENKDLLNPFRPVDTNHLDILRRIVDDTYARFCTLVAKGRNLPIEQVRSFADGSVFTATEAQKRNMIDSIGFWDDAIRTAAAELGVEAIRVVRYYEPPRLFRELFGMDLSAAARRIIPRAAPQLLMIWAP